MSLYIFVYGLLRKDELYHSFIEENNFIYKGIYKTVKPYYFLTDRDSDQAFVVDPEDFGEKHIDPVQVIGEVYEVQKMNLGLLEIDAFVGHPNRFMRTVIECMDDKGNKLTCFMYLAKGVLLKNLDSFLGIEFFPVISGDWFDYKM